MRRPLPRADQPLLQAHHAVPPRPSSPPAGTSSCQREGRRAFFVRIGEHADVVEPVIGDEAAQLIDVCLGLAGKADDERRPEGDARDLARGSGRAARRTSARVPGRFIRFSTGSDACCSGRSMYLQTLSHSAMAASVSSSMVVG